MVNEELRLRKKIEEKIMAGFKEEEGGETKQDQLNK